MKATTKKLITAIFVLAVAIALAASSTYAWFAMTNQTEIQPFDIEVTAGENLLIAVTIVGGNMPDLGNFKAYISSDEIVDNPDNEEIDGVGRFYKLVIDEEEETITETEDENIKKLGLATANGNLAFSVADSVTSSLLPGEGAYFAFDVHFIADRAYDVKLNTGTTVTSSTGDPLTVPVYAWKTDATSYGNPITINQPIQAAAANAVRIAFQTVEYASTGGGEGEDEPIPAAYKIYEPNEDQGWGNYGGTGNIAVDYYNYINGDDNALSSPTSVPYTSSLFTNLGTGSQVLVSLTGLDIQDYANEEETHYGKFTVKIWLEGWDADAFDSIKNQTITTVLKFIGVEA